MHSFAIKFKKKTRTPLFGYLQIQLRFVQGPGMALLVSGWTQTAKHASTVVADGFKSFVGSTEIQPEPDLRTRPTSVTLGHLSKDAIPHAYCTSHTYTTSCTLNPITAQYVRLSILSYLVENMIINYQKPCRARPSSFPGRTNPTSFFSQ